MRSEFSFAAAIGIAGVLAAPSTAARTIVRSDNSVYKVVDLEWDVPINVTHTTSVTGTIQDVLRTVREADPARAASMESSIMAKNGSRGGVFARNDVHDVDHVDNDADVDVLGTSNFNKCGKVTLQLCGIPGRKAAKVSYIWEGIYYLDTFDGQPKSDPGPGMCGRVSCSYNSAIYWCNNNPEEKTIESFNCIADGAAHLVKDCVNDNGEVQGREEFEGNWSVEVFNEKC